MSRKTLFLLLILVSAIATGLQAQTSRSDAAQSGEAVVPVALGQSIIALTGPWKFHVGDDKLWADPSFDDSNWQPYDLVPDAHSLTPEQALQLEELPGWQHHGYPRYAGYGWYRIHLEVGSDSHPVSLLMPQYAEDAYEIYLNGRLVGSYGKLDGFHKTYDQRPQLFLIPTAVLNSSRPVTLAIRFWSMPSEASPDPQNPHGGLRGVPLIGPSALLQIFQRSVPDPSLGWDTQTALFGWMVQPVLYIGIGLISIFLFLFSKGQREYLWAGIALTGRGFLIAAIYIESSNQISQQLGDTAQQAALLVSVFSMPLGAMWLLGVPRRRWLRANAVVLALFCAEDLTSLGVELGGIPANSTFDLIKTLLGWLPRTALGLLLLSITFDGVRILGRKAWVLITPGILFAFHMVLYMFLQDVFNGVGILDQLLSAGVPVSVLFIFLVRFTQQQRENGRLVEDMRQAREVQQLMIPDKLQQVSWLEIESEYHPAREVGGDFFQIIPVADDGSVLIVLGDVTGHGLQAGMLVALIVGAITTEATHTADPSQLLHALNARLCARGHSQATCLAVRIFLDGKAILANAGHIPPYLNGKELPIDGSLPLGMIGEASFSILEFNLNESDHILLISDGVVEAQNQDGQLFGFDRIRQLLAARKSAHQLAAAAARFGQEDDITVLSITRTKSRQEALA